MTLVRLASAGLGTRPAGKRDVRTQATSFQTQLGASRVDVLRDSDHPPRMAAVCTSLASALVGCRGATK
jgi:hypothetical protein